MKNLKEFLPNKMVALLVVVFVLIGHCALGQSERSKKKNRRAFIRVYRLDGKVTRGVLTHVSDSTFIMQSNHDGVNFIDSIHYKEIAFVRRGRSTLHYFVVQGIIGFGIALPIAALGHATTSAGVTMTNTFVSPLSGSNTPVIPEPESHVISNSLKAGLLVGLCSALIHSPKQKKLRVDGSLEKFTGVGKVLYYTSM